MTAMARGDHLNITEDRPVMHMALRAPRDQVRSTCACSSVCVYAIVCAELHVACIRISVLVHMVERGKGVLCVYVIVCEVVHSPPYSARMMFASRCCVTVGYIA